MKRIKIILAILLIVVSSVVVGAVSTDKKIVDQLLTKTEIISFSSPIFDKKDDYVTLDFFESKSYLMKPGEPMLPMISRTFMFPLGTKIFGTQVEIDTTYYFLTGVIYPCPTMRITGENEHYTYSETCVINITTYNSDKLYPHTPYFVQSGSGIDNGRHVIFYTIHVVPQYNPIENSILIPSEVMITIQYIPPKMPIVVSDAYDLVIITPDVFSETLQPLINHKNSVGIRTFLKTTEEIYAEWYGRDCSEQIKYFIKDAIENFNIQYVFLIGDIDFLPMRLCDITIMLWDMRWVLSDLYYADIYDCNGSFCSWDSNENNIFCEIYCPSNQSVRNESVYIDKVDLYPDVGIGRLPCRNINELQILLDKIISYETLTFEHDWFNNILLMGGDTFTSSSWADCGANEGEIVCEQIAELLPTFNTIKLYTSTGDFRPMKINKAINSGTGFVAHCGHGFENGIGTYPPDTDRLIMYYKLFLLGLGNKGKLPVIFLDACLTAKLDYNFLGFSLPCFAYSLVKHRFGGGIACIGSTQLSYGWVFKSGADSGSPYLQLSFFDSYKPGIILSDMFTTAQNKYLNDLGIDGLTLGEFILIGDPSLKIGGYAEI